MSVSLIIATLADGDSFAGLYFCREPDDVPVCKTNAAMARGTTDRFGTVGTVNADSFFVECDPHHPNWIARTWRKQIEIAATLAVLEHFPADSYATVAEDQLQPNRQLQADRRCQHRQQASKFR